MANNIYKIDGRTASTSIVTIADNSGIDWLVYDGSFPALSEIYLNWVVNGSTTISGYGQYVTGQSGRALTIIGVVENAKGGNANDKITGNQFDNILYGDKSATARGGSDRIFGLNGKDTIYGGGSADVIEGGGHNDSIFGNAGDDLIYGDNSGVGIFGSDTIEGGGGADTIYGGYNNDWVSYNTSNAGVTVALIGLDTSTGRGGHAQGDKINGVNNIIGSVLDDVLIGRTHPTLNTPDSYLVNSFRGGRGNDVLRLGDADDIGDGGVGNDSIFGESDNDRLIGGGGSDQLWGGGGADIFIFGATSHSTVALSGRDTIYDFRHAQDDKISLIGIDAIAATANIDDQFRFINGNVFSGRAGEIRVTEVSGGLLVEGNTTQDRTADFAIFVSGINRLIADDFLL